MKLLEKIKNIFIKKKTESKESEKFSVQKAWFMENLPKRAASREDEDYCYNFIAEISEHFNPIEFEEFPFTLKYSENMLLSKHFADLTKDYVNYRKGNDLLLKEFFTKSSGKLSMYTIQNVKAFLEQDDLMSEKIFLSYTQLARLFLMAAEIKKQEEKD